MSERAKDWISEVVFNTPRIGFVTYWQLLEKFPEQTIAWAKKTLYEFFEEYPDHGSPLFDVTWKSTENGKLSKKLATQEEMLDLIEDHEDDIQDVELLCIAGTEELLSDFMIGKRSNELIETICKMGSLIKFTPSKEPPRRAIKIAAIGNKKIDSKKKASSKITQAKPMQKTEVSYRGVGSKAGTQMKASDFFDKSDSKQVPVVPKPPVQINKSKSQITANISLQEPNKDPVKIDLTHKNTRKRKFEELEISPSNDKDHLPKRSRKIDRTIEKANFDPSAPKFDPKLYSVDETSSENSDKPHLQMIGSQKIKSQKVCPPSPPAPAAPRPHKSVFKKSGWEDKKEEKYLDMEVDEGENVQPNFQNKIIQRKVFKEKTYLDEDGFEVTNMVEEYEDFEVKVDINKNKNLPKPESKPSMIKKMPKGQKTLSAFFKKS
jgi:hypothetical protein